MPDRALFQGVVTFLMTDVEGSTRLWEDDPPAMAAAMQAHDAIAERVVDDHGGIVVKERGEGDALFCVFDRPGQAVKAAIAIQNSYDNVQWPTPRPIKVRFALHVGEPELRAGDYYGPVVNRCARLRSICFGEQIILSEAVKALIPNLAHEDYTLLDLGSHRLKDLSTPEQVFQVVAPGLPMEFPALLSIGNFPNNLPQHASSFVGREKEAAEVLAAVEKGRLVTLVGPGGTGKTRLSQHVAEGQIEQYPDGVWLVELDRLTDPESITLEIAQVLKIPESSTQSPLQMLTTTLEKKKLLLLLDNCEHLKGSVATLVHELIRKTEHVKVLATSREPLGITGESLFRVPSLGVPLEGDDLDPLTMMGYEAVRLFMERGQSVRSDLELTLANSASVGRICRQLDGIPFALELAAARARALSVEQIADRIEDRFRILGKGDTSRASRQHTLKALVDWSYELLNPAERAVLNRLSVFVGGCSLESAEAIAGFGEIEDFEVMDHLISLVDKSLVVYDQDLQRYRLLETIRQYGREKLEEARESEEAQSRHAGYFHDQAKHAAVGLKGRDPKAWMDRIDSDLDNFRFAARLLHSSNPSQQAELIVGLFRYFDAQAIFAEPREQLLEVLPLLSDSDQVGLIHQVLGNLARRQGDFATAEQHLAQAKTFFEQTGDRVALASTAINLAAIYLYLGRSDDAEATARPALAVCEEVKDYRGLVTAHLTLGNVMALRKEQLPAAEEFEQALAKSKEYGLPDLQLYAQVNLGLNLSKRGEFEAAIPQFNEVLRLAHSMGVRALALDTLRFLAQAHVGNGNHSLAAALYGLEEALRDKSGVKLGEADTIERESDLKVISDALGPESLTTQTHRFIGTPFDAAVDQIVS